MFKYLKVISFDSGSVRRKGGKAPKYPMVYHQFSDWWPFGCTPFWDKPKYDKMVAWCSKIHFPYLSMILEDVGQVYGMTQWRTAEVYSFPQPVEWEVLSFDRRNLHETTLICRLPICPIPCRRTQGLSQGFRPISTSRIFNGSIATMAIWPKSSWPELYKFLFSGRWRPRQFPGLPSLRWETGHLAAHMCQEFGRKICVWQGPFIMHLYTAIIHLYIYIYIFVRCVRISLHTYWWYPK